MDEIKAAIWKRCVFMLCPRCHDLVVTLMRGL